MALMAGFEVWVKLAVNRGKRVRADRILYDGIAILGYGRTDLICGCISAKAAVHVKYL